MQILEDPLLTWWSFLPIANEHNRKWTTVTHSGQRGNPLCLAWLEIRTAVARRNQVKSDTGEYPSLDHLTQDWRGTVSFVLPNFHELDKILDITERDDAGAVLVVPEWPYQALWRRLHSAACKCEMQPQIVGRLQSLND